MPIKEHIIDIDRSDNSRKEIRQGLDEIHDQSRFLAIMEMKQVDITNPKFDIQKRGNYRIIIRDGEELGYIKGRENVKDWMEYRISYMKSKEQADYTATTKVELKRNKLIIKTKQSLDTLKDDVMMRDAKNISKIYEKRNLPMLLNMVREKIKEHKDEIRAQRQQGNRSEKRMLKYDIDVLRNMERDIESTLKKSTEAEKASDLELYVPRLIATLGIQNAIERSEDIKILLGKSDIAIEKKRRNAKLDSAITTACIKARYGSFEEAFRKGGFAGAIGHGLDSGLDALGMKNQMSDRQRLNAQKFLGLGLTIGAGVLAFNYLRQTFTGKDGKGRGFDRGRAALLGGGFLGYQMFAGEKGYKQAGADLINYFAGEGQGGNAETNTEYSEAQTQNGEIVSPWPGYVFINSDAKKKAQELYKSYGGNSEAFTDEYYKKLFENQGLLKKSSNNKTPENNNNTYGGVYEPYRDGQKEANLTTQIDAIENSIPEAERARRTTVKPSVEKHVNLLHQNHPNGRPIKLDLVDLGKKKFKLESYGNSTYLEIQAPDRIFLYGPHDKAWTTPLKSMSEAMRTANLVNRLCRDYKGKSKESRPRHVSNAGVGSGMSYNIEFEHESTGRALSERRWLPQGDTSDPELRDDRGTQFETLYPSIDTDKGDNAGTRGFVGFLNDFGIWTNESYVSQIEATTASEKALKEKIAKDLGKDINSNEVNRVYSLGKYLQRLKELGYTTGKTMSKDGEIFIESTKKGWVKLTEFVDEYKYTPGLVVGHMAGRTVESVARGVGVVAKTAIRNAGNAIYGFFDYFNLAGQKEAKK